MSTYLEGVGLDTATARCISAVAVTSGSLMTRKPVAYSLITVPYTGVLRLKYPVFSDVRQSISEIPYVVILTVFKNCSAIISSIGFSGKWAVSGSKLQKVLTTLGCTNKLLTSFPPLQGMARTSSQ